MTDRLKPLQMVQILSELRCLFDFETTPEQSLASRIVFWRNEAARREAEAAPKKRWSVSYYYLATGMEGQADERDMGVVEADTALEARQIVADRQYKRGTRDWQFEMGCLSAKELSREAEASVNAAVELLAEEHEQNLRDMYEGPGSAAAPVSRCPSCPGGKVGAVEAHEPGCELAPKDKPAPAGDRNLVTDASTLVFKQLEAAEARVRELEAQILSHIQANDVSCKGWAAEKARADRLAAAIRDIDRACNMAEVHRIAVDALASEGGDRG